MDTQETVLTIPSTLRLSLHSSFGGGAFVSSAMPSCAISKERSVQDPVDPEIRGVDVDLGLCDASLQPRLWGPQD